MDRESQQAEYAKMMGGEALDRQVQAAEKMRCKCNLPPATKQISGSHHRLGCRLYVAGLKR